MDQNYQQIDNVFAAIKAGDEEVFAILFRKYYKKLCGFCFNYVKRYDVAEELASDALLSLWRKREEIQITLSLTAYLYKTARNISINYLEGKEGSTRLLSIYANEEHTTDGESLLLTSHAYHQPDREEQVDEEVFHNKVNSIYSAIVSLTPLRKEILELHFLKGLRAKDIATRLSISEKMVRNNIERGTRQVRRIVKPEQGSAGTLLFLLTLQEAFFLMQ